MSEGKNKAYYTVSTKQVTLDNVKLIIHKIRRILIHAVLSQAEDNV